MAEPKDKSTPEWRDWYVRHIMGGESAAILKNAASDKINLSVIREYLADLEKQLNN